MKFVFKRCSINQNRSLLIKSDNRRFRLLSKKSNRSNSDRYQIVQCVSGRVHSGPTTPPSRERERGTVPPPHFSGGVVSGPTKSTSTWVSFSRLRQFPSFSPYSSFTFPEGKESNRFLFFERKMTEAVRHFFRFKGSWNHAVWWPCTMGWSEKLTLKLKLGSFQRSTPYFFLKLVRIKNILDSRFIKKSCMFLWKLPVIKTPDRF